MAFDPRIEDLLARYPQDLTDAELAELRAAAEQDEALEDRLDALVDVEAALQDDPAPVLSDIAAKRLERLMAQVPAATASSDKQDHSETSAREEPRGGQVIRPKAWSTGGATPGGGVVDESTVESPKAWSTGGATPGGGIVDLAERRRFKPGPLLAIAAVLVLAAPFVLRELLVPPIPTHIGIKGLPIAASLQVWNGEGQLPADAPQCAADAVFFAVDVSLVDGAELKSASTALIAHLVLIEEQGGESFVVYPPPGGEWSAGIGPSWIESGGLKAPYKPANPGLATYTLVGSLDPLPVPEDRAVSSAADYAAEQTSADDAALTFPSRTVQWNDCGSDEPGG